MKKIFKKEVIIGIICFVIGIILASSITAYAVISASQIDYKNNQKVDDALDDLYSKSSELNTIKTNVNQTDATASDILSGKKAYTQNGLITGTLNSTGENTYWYQNDEYYIPSTSYSINLGFRASMIRMFCKYSNSEEYLMFNIGNNFYGYNINDGTVSNWSNCLSITETGLNLSCTSGWVGKKLSIYAMP